MSIDKLEKTFVSNKYLVTIHHLIVDFSFFSLLYRPCKLHGLSCQNKRVRINAKVHHFKTTPPLRRGHFGASILAPAALDLGAFGASWPPKRNVWIRPWMAAPPKNPTSTFGP